jgi:alpha-glucosidase
MKKGDMTFIDSPGETLVFTRSHKGETVLCAFNLANTEETLTLSGLQLENLNAPGFSGSIDGSTISLGGLDAAFARVLS